VVERLTYVRETPIKGRRTDEAIDEAIDLILEFIVADLEDRGIVRMNSFDIIDDISEVSNRQWIILWYSDSMAVPTWKVFGDKTYSLYSSARVIVQKLSIKNPDFNTSYIVTTKRHARELGALI
jgi:hypothetical protein